MFVNVAFNICATKLRISKPIFLMECSDCLCDCGVVTLTRLESVVVSSGLTSIFSLPGLLSKKRNILFCEHVRSWPIKLEVFSILATLFCDINAKLACVSLEVGNLVCRLR